MDNKVYVKGNSYLGDDMTRPFIQGVNRHRKLCYRSFAALHEENMFFKLNRQQQSNWIEDNNHINENLKYTLEEIYIVLAMFDMLITGHNIEWE